VVDVARRSRRCGRSERLAIEPQGSPKALRLGDFGVPLGDAGLGPALCDQQGPLRVLVVQLDPDLCTDASISRSATVRCSETIVIACTSARRSWASRVDFRLGGVAASEHAEVDADVSVVVEEGDRARSCIKEVLPPL
jgi:hypothetical protein